MAPFRKFLNTAASISLLLVLLSGNSVAQAADPSTASISVSPPRFELFGNPGDTLSEKIKISNPSDAELTYSIEVEDFTAQGDEGGVDFLDKDAPNNNFSLAKWVTVEPTKFTVAANSDRILNYSIRIPKGAEPGGHYASVLVKLAGANTSGASGASVQSRVGSLILLRVSGDIKESLSVDYFKTDNFYYQKGPVTFALRSKNDGNVHVAPSGTIIIKNTFNKKVKELPLNQANVLPGASRISKTVWDDKALLGRYTATLVATYGSSQTAIGQTTSFIVISPILILIIIAVLVIAFLLITKRKSFKKFINRLTSD